MRRSTSTTTSCGIPWMVVSVTFTGAQVAFYEPGQTVSRCFRSMSMPRRGHRAQLPDGSGRPPANLSAVHRSRLVPLSAASSPIHPARTRRRSRLTSCFRPAASRSTLRAAISARPALRRPQNTQPATMPARRPCLTCTYSPSPGPLPHLRRSGLRQVQRLAGTLSRPVSPRGCGPLGRPMGEQPPMRRACASCRAPIRSRMSRRSRPGSW
jgi:hypothetical protein